MIFCVNHTYVSFSWLGPRRGSLGEGHGDLDALSAGLLPPPSCSLPLLHSPGHVIESIAQLRKQQVGLLTSTLDCCHED